MPKRHPYAVRAAAVAAVLAGDVPAEVAKRFGVSRGRLHEWCQTDGVPALPSTRSVPERSGTETARTRERMANLIYDCLADTLTTVRAQLQAAAREEWLEKQSAADLARLLDRELDGAIRLLAGFRPAEKLDERDGPDDPG